MLFPRQPFGSHLRAGRCKAVGALAVTAIVSLAAAGCGSHPSTASATTLAQGNSQSSSQTTAAQSATTTGAAGSATTTSDPNGDSGSGDDATTTTSASSTASTAPVALPTAPTGAFLSSHRLSLTGSDVPSTARSVCVTSVGATCTIRFTNNGVTKSLPIQKVDASGTTSWDWSASSVGLTVGHWDVQIVAETAVGQRTVTEAIGLDVVA